MIKKKAVAKICIIVLITLVLCASGFVILMWYLFEYTGNLQYYEFENIREIEAKGDTLVWITETGDCYVSGGYETTGSIKYANTEHKNYMAKNVPKPVKCFDGVAKRAVICDNLLLIISETKKLYSVSDKGTKLLAEGVLGAVQVDNGEFCYIDEAGNLIKITSEENHVKIAEKVSKIQVCDQWIFILYNNGKLIAYDKKFTDNLRYSNYICSDVRDFEAVKNSLRYDSVKGYYDLDGDISERVTITLLDHENNLYVKGSYSLLYNRHKLFTDIIPPVKEYKEFTLIAESVEYFKSSSMGTVIRHSDGQIAYFGNNTSWESDPWVGYMDLELNDIIDIDIAASMIYALTEEGVIYCWGSNDEAQYKLHQIDDIENNVRDDPACIFDPRVFRLK